ncbi:MAG: phytanoyl-CoA dioxygenase family protein [Lentisphaeria bacterium]|nr:phytanoyl-CoA dioxygenase family protein [Lentisphaeria bacterium]
MATEGEDVPEKDLSFKRCENTNPKYLTLEEIQHYNEKGYISGCTGYEGDDVIRIRKYFDNLLDEFQNTYGQDAYAINGYHSICEGLYDIVMNDRILDLVEDLIGPDIIAWGTHFFCKLPGDPKNVPFHQDASYWPLTPSRTVTCWLAIDDADIENAAMMFLPATHDKGHLEWRNSKRDSYLHQEIVDINQYGEIFHNVLKAGKFSLHADMLAHGSEPNESDRRRCGLTIRYCTPDVTQTVERWGHAAVLCRGEDPDNNWTHNERPVGEDLSVKLTPIGGN